MGIDDLNKVAQNSGPLVEGYDCDDVRYVISKSRIIDAMDGDKAVYLAFSAYLLPAVTVGKTFGTKARRWKPEMATPIATR
jgi:hypothetical protein